MDRWCFDCDLRCTQGHLVCDKVNTANLKWCDFHYEVRALRKPLIHMIFPNYFIEIHSAGLVGRRGSRECIKNAFADNLLAAQRIARH